VEASVPGPKGETGPAGPQGPIGPAGPAGADATNGIATPFVAADLVAGILTINHSLTERFVDVAVWDDSGQRIRPSRVMAVDDATLTVDLAVFTIAGSWHYKVFR